MKGVRKGAGTSSDRVTRSSSRLTLHLSDGQRCPTIREEDGTSVHGGLPPVCCSGSEANGLPETSELSVEKRGDANSVSISAEEILPSLSCIGSTQKKRGLDKEPLLPEDKVSPPAKRTATLLKEKKVSSISSSNENQPSSLGQGGNSKECGTIIERIPDSPEQTPVQTSAQKRPEIETVISCDVEVVSSEQKGDGISSLKAKEDKRLRQSSLADKGKVNNQKPVQRKSSKKHKSGTKASTVEKTKCLPDKHKEPSVLRPQRKKPVSQQKNKVSSSQQPDTKKRPEVIDRKQADLYNLIIQNATRSLNTAIYQNNDISKVMRQSIRQSLDPLLEAFRKLHEENKTLWCMLDRESSSVAQKAIVTGDKPDIPPVRSYASVTRNNQEVKHPVAVKPRAKVETHVVFVKPKKASNQQPSEILSEFLKVIKPRENRLRLNRVNVRRSDSTIVVECADKASLSSVESNTLLRESSKVSVLSKKKPRISIRAVPSTLDSKEMVDSIYDQNIDDRGGVNHNTRDIRPLYKTGRKGLPLCNWIVEVSSGMRSTLIKRQWLYIGHQRCRIDDHTEPTRCFKCQNFGHTAKVCHEKTPCCSMCTVKGHLTADCPTKDRVKGCINCSRAHVKYNTTHSANDRKCPVYVRATERLIAATDYGEHI